MLKMQKFSFTRHQITTLSGLTLFDSFQISITSTCKSLFKIKPLIYTTLALEIIIHHKVDINYKNKAFETSFHVT